MQSLEGCQVDPGVVGMSHLWLVQTHQHVTQFLAPKFWTAITTPLHLIETSKYNWIPGVPTLPIAAVQYQEQAYSICTHCNCIINNEVSNRQQQTHIEHIASKVSLVLIYLVRCQCNACFLAAVWVK